MEHDLVIAGTDGSPQSLRAVEWAAHEAALRGGLLQILCVPALPSPMSWQRAPQGTPDTVADIIIQTAEHILAKAADCAGAAEPGLVVETALRHGPPAVALARAAASASLVVVGSHGSGHFPALAHRSVSRYLGGRAACPVVVVRQVSTAVHGEVVVGVRDCDQPAAIGFAFEEASLRHASLRAVHAWHWLRPGGADRRVPATGDADGDAAAQAAQWLAELLAFWREKYPEVDVAEDVVHAPPGRALAARSAGADLVILGRNTPDDLILPPESATAVHGVLSHAHCPVAIVPE